MADGYLKSAENAEWFAVLARGSIAFRYGPYTGEEVGRIMAQCQDERIPVSIVASCGKEFDWDVARDFARGTVADWRPMDEAPLESVIIGNVSGIEIPIIWWQNWESWRELEPDLTTAGKPVAPTSWRLLEPSDDEAYRKPKPVKDAS